MTYSFVIPVPRRLFRILPATSSLGDPSDRRPGLAREKYSHCCTAGL